MTRRRPPSAVSKVAAAFAGALVAISAGGVMAGHRVSASPADDPAPPPAQWPASPLLAPRIEGYANAVRLSGPDRYQTSLAAALALRGAGGFPFDSPDRTSGGGPLLADADGWWGVGACPRAVIITTGDVPADALAASVLSDPTGQSHEPFLQRTASATPEFNPPGGFTRVDTDAAPIIVTASARQGATALSPAARQAARDVRQGGCTTARQAIVVGGPEAVPLQADQELLSIGYDEVFRVYGANRYETAAMVARSLGTASRPSGVTACADPSAGDGDARMAFYANSVVEYRPSATSCELLGRTIVLADGVTGADALAAGWWTSFWQTPILLHDASDRLPAATVNALVTMDVEHVIVLGGPNRISDAVVAEIAAVTGAQTRRVAGADRYETSVVMARSFGGWWPTGGAAEFRGSLVCLAASAGQGPQAQGWPDALSAGPWCGTANGAAYAPGAPDRALAPTTGASPIRSLERGAPGRAGQGHDAVPVLLVRAGATSLPPSVEAFLTASFAPGGSWCTSAAAPGGCRVPGFAVAFGGASVLTDSVLARVSELVSGRPAEESGSEPAVLSPPFVTGLDLSPVYGESGVGSLRVCAERGGYEFARWLAVFEDVTVARPLGLADVMMDGRYIRDADGVARSPGVGAPQCVAFDPDARSHVAVRAVGPAGRASGTRTVAAGVAARMAMTGPLSAPAGSATDPNEHPGLVERVFSIGAPSPAVAFTTASDSADVQSGTLLVRIEPGVDPAALATFTATWTVNTTRGNLAGAVEGEAILVGTVWELRGAGTVTPGSWSVGPGTGGFRAAIDLGAPGDRSDDTASWQLDAILGV